MAGVLLGHLCRVRDSRPALVVIVRVNLVSGAVRAPSDRPSRVAHLAGIVRDPGSTLRMRFARECEAGTATRLAQVYTGAAWTVRPSSVQAGI
jgi:hypothetical protein